MILQNVVLPNELCEERKIYFQCDEEVQFDEAVIHMNSGTSLSTYSYMNLFDSRTWGKYTNLDGWNAHVIYTGDAKIRLSEKNDQYYVEIYAWTDTKIYGIRFETNDERKENKRNTDSAHHMYLSPKKGSKCES